MTHRSASLPALPPRSHHSVPRSIAIAGCGPCGLAAALLLARQGERVTLFERFAAPQPIGSGLMIQPTGLAVLERLGLAGRIAAEGARIDRLHGLAGKRVALGGGYAALKSGGRLHGIGIHRASLFAALYDAVLASGIVVRTGTPSPAHCSRLPDAGSPSPSRRQANLSTLSSMR